MHILKIKKISKGFAMLEVMISILLFTVAIVGTLETQAFLTEASNQAKYRSEAVELATKITSQIMLDKNNLTSYNGTNDVKDAWVSEIQKKLPGGDGTIAVVGNQVSVSVVWQSKKDLDEHQYTIVTNISY